MKDGKQIFFSPQKDTLEIIDFVTDRIQSVQNY
jgi:hypothetical protein